MKIELTEEQLTNILVSELKAVLTNEMVNPIRDQNQVYEDHDLRKAIAVLLRFYMSHHDAENFLAKFE